MLDFNRGGLYWIAIGGVALDFYRREGGRGVALDFYRGGGIALDFNRGWGRRWTSIGGGG